MFLPKYTEDNKSNHLNVVAFLMGKILNLICIYINGIHFIDGFAACRVHLYVDRKIPKSPYGIEGFSIIQEQK